jgi:hypothetical protein
MFVTSEGHPGARLQRALAAGNLTAAEQAVFEAAFAPLEQARLLVELCAEKGDRKFERAALKIVASRGDGCSTGPVMTHLIANGNLTLVEASRELGSRE